MSSDKLKDVKAAGENAAETARDEIEAVKAHVERLITKHIVPALTNAGGKAENLTEQAVANARELANHARNDISKQTRGPSSLVSIAISGVVGFILGRLSR
ncbi:hypothetical protein ACLEIY_13820 [Acetobacter tropicalis]|jgi:F0F1-type ATP synthase assembly protein I|uniref:DUF883 family protein n=3 Tax=Acetobacter TaxID=434 RepID=A0A0U5F0M3_9PROT|nr:MULTISPECIES: hypothetical protein [Acetobacter]ATJ89605.1 hypothetical protein CIW82_01655 [Acetobacter tropicalis]KAA8386655.1 hypothetical protein FOH24_14915 [Acetobacter tropicalis]KAA8388843.1 hypothetical protein FOH22_07600 [Acetobacter tropicalis]KGB20807.1 hypothetical protein AtDm6_3586 [Acetobacter tropicalis]KXV46432.1 hypothetical protein AD944_13085 [Acetobacter tropicalis]